MITVLNMKQLWRRMGQVCRKQRKYLILFCFLSLILSLDQWTKSWIQEQFYLGETLSIIFGFFNLTYVQNTGAAFGFLAQTPPLFRVPFFLLVPVIALSSIFYVFRKISHQDCLLSVALSLIVSGAIGNLIDRVRFGYVIDFLDFHWKWKAHFPVFNVADSVICIGVSFLTLDLWNQKSRTVLSEPSVLKKTPGIPSQKKIS